MAVVVTAPPRPCRLRPSEPEVRPLNSSTRRLTTTVVVIGIVATAAAVALGARGPLPALVPLLVLGVLHALAENQSANLPEGIGSSAGIILVTASMMVFRDDVAWSGPVLVGAFGGLYLGHLRSFEWRKVLFNMAMLALASLAATATFWALTSSSSDPALALLGAALPAALAYSTVNLVLVAVVVGIATNRPPSVVFRTAAREYLAYFPFAVVGVFLGRLYLEFGPALVPLLVVPIFVARQTYSAYLALKESHEATVRILIGALEAKDRYTAGHAERVARYAAYIGQELGLPPNRMERLRFAALMHDVGKLVVPNHLLNKPAKLTASEFAQVRKHEEVSVEILTRIEFLAPVAPSAMSEHTRFAPVADDRGQPIEPHIVAVADAYDAMTSTRSYRRALSQEVAFAELRKNAGEQFHPRVVDALIAAITRRGERHGAGHEEDLHHFVVPPPDAGTGSAGLGDLLPEPLEEAAGQ